MIKSIVWTSDAQSNLISILVLEIINKKTSYGYEIKKLVESLMKEYYLNYEFKLSSLYSLLRRLETKKYIDAFKDIEAAVNERDKTRTFYKITSEGKKELKIAWQEWRDLFSLFQSISKRIKVNVNAS
jgi:DNA-binding PadR family transcriptional regulator